MSIEPDAMADEPHLAGGPEGPAALPWTRVFYWSLRRELWENRAIYVAPLAAAGVALFGFLLSAFTLPRALRGASVLVDPKKHESLLGPYSFVAFSVLVTSFIVVIFYCLGALHGERRDRSILFWKSLPVSDLTTVLSKAAVAILVIPAVIFAATVSAQLVVLIMSTLIVLLNGLDPHVLWARVSLWFMWTVLANAMVFFALWYAPVWAWLLLVSAWARRTTFLWAVAPPLAIGAVEWLVVGKKGAFRALIDDRLLGGFAQAFSVNGQAKIPLRGWADFDPARMFSNPGLWIGLVFAALFLAAAVRLRRSRDPI